MNETTETNKAYERLTPQRKALVDQVIKNLETSNGLWTQGWVGSGVPESAITGKKYHGVNNFYLTLVAMMSGYKDNRWATFKQIEENNWKFKTDEEGKSLGKGNGVSVEFFELRDKETKRRFDSSVLDGMTPNERQEYMDKNVYPIRKYYRVFNGDIIDGIPAKETHIIDPNSVVERAENILDYWNTNEAKIIYGGNEAYYKPSTDEIHLPERGAFLDMQEFYSTALHEVGHSTGHQNRLNRDLTGKFGSSDYALEELRAEIASMFMEQDLELSVTEKHIENNSKYIKAWKDKIQEDPNALFTAISDADKISKFVIEREKQATREKNTEPYAIVVGENELGEPTYTVHSIWNYGQTRAAINYAFSSREALMEEFERYKKAPMWKDKEFKEVSLDELQELSIKRYEAEERKAERESGEEFIPPSEVAAKAYPKTKPVDMKDRGVDSLTRMSDREIVERASQTKNGDKFTSLYSGTSIFNNEEKDERSLMTRLAMFCKDDQEQLLRIFKSSGQFRDDKPNSYYENMAKESMQFISRLQKENADKGTKPLGKGHFGANAKT